MSSNSEASALPDLGNLHQLLAPWRGSTAAMIPMTNSAGRPLGNNGDRLMYAVFLRVLGSLSIEVLEPGSRATPDVVIVPPNGAMLEMYSFPKILAERLKAYIDVPLVMFPNSALFPTMSPAYIFRGRRKPATWILREANSLRHLTDLYQEELGDVGVSLHLDHDIVASGRMHVPGIVGSGLSRSGPRLLVAARRDPERNGSQAAATVSGAGRSRSMLKLVDRLRRSLVEVPDTAVKTQLTRAVVRGRIRDSSETLLRKAIRVSPDLQEIAQSCSRRTDLDISASHLITFEGYKKILRQSDVVVTDRLHVALPAAILGKQVWMVEGSYHKLSGVYEQSMKGFSGVRLARADALDG